MAALGDGAMDEIPLQEEDSLEYKILMAYASRSLSASKFRDLQNQVNGVEEDMDTKRTPDTEDAVAENEKDLKGHKTSKMSKKKNKKWLRRMTPKCLKGEMKMETEAHYAGGQEANFENIIARKLHRIVQSQLRKPKRKDAVAFRSLGLETDGNDNDKLIREIVRLLKDYGDQLNKEMQEKPTLLQQFRQAFSYNFLEGLANFYIKDSKPRTQATEVAMCFDLITKLTASDTQPMNKVLGFGVQYIQTHYTPLIQKQGGWEKFAMEINPEEEEMDPDEEIE